MQVIIGSGGNENLCDYVYDIKRFNSGEIEILLPQWLTNKDVVVFHRINISSVHDSLFEVLMVAMKCRDLGVKSLSLIIPYLPYSRCEKTSLKDVYYILKAVGISKIITADIHSLDTHEIEIHNIPLASLIIKEFKVDLKNKLIVSPDTGGYYRAQQVSEEFGCDFICMDKIRVGDVVDHILKFDVAGRDIIIVDDIVDSGMTINSAAQTLKDSGAESVEVIASHLVRIPDLNQIDCVYTTDSVRHLSYPEKFRVLKLQREVFLDIWS